MRITVLATALCLSIVGSSIAGPAAAAIRRDTNVAPQPLAQALSVFAKQRGLILAYRSEVVGDRQSVGAVGELTTDEALTKILSGTGLSFKYLDDRTITIVATSAAEGAGAAPGQPSTAPPTGENSPKGSAMSGSYLLAQAVSGQPASSAASSSQVGEPATERHDSLQEIIVTAQKREQRLIDVPISLAALSGDEIRARQIASMDDLASAVPGLAIEDTAGGTRRISIRGISNDVGSYSPVIGVYLDEADVTSGLFSQLDLNVYDLERVEVLRGPQGTLYGEGSAGGTIRFITKNPDLTKLTFNADAAVLFTQYGAPSQRIQQALNVPLVNDQLGLRFAGTFEHDGGWIDQPAAAVKNFNERNLIDFRAKGLWQPTSEFTVSALAEIHRNDESSNAGEDVNGEYTQVFGLTTTPHLVDDFDIYNLTLSYQFAGAQLINTTTYVSQYQDQQNFGFTFAPLPPPLPPLEALFTQVFYKLPSWTEELRLSSTGSGPWQWTIGAFYRHFRFEEDGAAIAGFPGPPGAPFPLQFDSVSKSRAAFADTSYRFADRLTVGAGVRYFQDDQDYSGGAPPSQTGTFRSTDPRGYVQYKINEQANIYASAAKGFRSGGFNSLNQPPYGPESVWTYELGTKMSLLDRRLDFDGAVFYSDYTQYQVYGVLPQGPPISIYSNAGNARVEGIEAQLTWHPSELWTLSISGDDLNTRFYKIDAASTAYNVGDNLDFFPKYAFTASAQRDMVLGSRHAFVRLDYNEQGRQTNRNRSYGPWAFYESDVIHMLNFNASLYWSDNLRLGIFAQNLLNDRGFTSAADVDPVPAGGFVGIRSRPRTFGLDFGISLK